MRTRLVVPLLLLAVVFSGCSNQTSPETRQALQVALANVEKSAAPKPVWPHDGSDLKVDPKVTWGRLDNGLRYVILPTQEAPGRASLKLHLDVGSLMEADDQQGMAHFLEHMAFNGTKHFPSGETTEYFQRLGMSFGAHTNAETNFDQTNYKLDIPRANEELTRDGLKLFRDFLDGMLLDEQAINKERGVILSEALARNSAEYRSAIASLQFTLGDTLIAKRMPIGRMETVKAMTRQRFVDFYETWYTPGRATVVAVGDFDVKMVERLIKEHFQDAKARRGEPANPDIGQVVATKAPLAKLYSDPAAEQTIVSMNLIRPMQPTADSFANQREEVTGLIGDIILNGRLAKIAALPNAPIQGGNALFERLFNIASNNGFAATCTPANWEKALGVLEQELQRAIQFGFTEDEFVEAKTILSTLMNAEVEQADTRKAGDLSDELVKSLMQNRVFSHPKDDLSIVQKMFLDLTKDQCELALRKAWQDQAVRIFVSGNVTLEGDAAAKILSVYAARQSQSVEPIQETKTAPFAYSNFGPAGEIMHRTEQADLGITSVEFANHVRVNFKRTAYEKNVARVVLHLGGGSLEVPTDKPGLLHLANHTLISGGLEAHTLTEINRLFADKTASVQFAVTDDSFQLGGSCAAKELEPQLQLCAAYLIAPGFRPETRDKCLESLDGSYTQILHTPEGAAQNEIGSFLRSGDQRFTLPPRDEMHKLTMDELKTWLLPILHAGYLEVAIVGDVDVEQALPLVAKTLGALPSRAAIKPAFAEQRKLTFPVGQRSKNIEFDSYLPRAMLCVAWETSSERSLTNDRRLSLLASVLNDRLRVKIRKECGATYTPEVINVTSDGFTDFGYLAAVMLVEEQRIAEIGKLVTEIAADMASGSISDDEFERAIKPVTASLDDLNNGYWLNVIGQCQARPEFLAAARNRKSDYTSITKDELTKLAKSLLSADKPLVVNVVPRREVK